jgi:hypothetical protein
VLRREQPPHYLNERRRWCTVGQARPLHSEESIGHVCIALRSVVDAHRNKECALAPYEVRALLGEMPFEAKVPLDSGLRPRGNDWYEERAITDLVTYALVPRIAAAQLALVEPNLNSGSPESMANPLHSLRVLRGVAQKYGASRHYRL